MMNDPKGIEAEFGYQKTAKGYDVPTKVIAPVAAEVGTP
jgi:hypothetical protein